MNLSKFADDYLSFSRKERIGLLGLLFLLVFILFMPSFKSFLTTRKPEKIDSSWIAALKNLELPSRKTTPLPGNGIKSPGPSIPDEHPTTGAPTGTVLAKAPKPPSFYFDPNRLPDTGWRNLGIPEKTVRVIRHFLEKGGRFRNPADLQRIYGLRQADYERLFPYLRMEEGHSAWTHSKKEPGNYGTDSAHTPPRYTLVEINGADTTALILLPGIGPKLAGRIVRFRDRLGGFYSREQLQEVYGIADSVFRKIKPWLKVDPGSVKKIRLNTATLEELQNHPYIRWKIARVIVEYRNQHGLFASLEDLKKIWVIPGDLYEKLVNYLTI